MILHKAVRCGQNSAGRERYCNLSESVGGRLGERKIVKTDDEEVNERTMHDDKEKRSK